MPLKNNYIELSKKIGGPYALISKGIKKGIVQSIMRGSIPRASELYKVAGVLGVSVEQLLTGEERYPARTEEQRIKEEDGYTIPLVNGYISGGTGAFPYEEMKEEIWLPKKYLSSPAGHACRYVAIAVSGNSMEPILQDGEVVVIDRADTGEKITKRSVYAVRLDHEVNVVKHVVKKGNLIELVSANPQWNREHGVEIIDLDKVKENPIIGKVVFSFRRWR